MENKLYNDFIQSEKTSGVILIICAIISIVIANCPLSANYTGFLHITLCSKPIHFWVNDGLMTIFFLLVGLEIEREIYIGELSNLKKSSLPIVAALGGMIVPPLIHFYFNHGTIYQNGFGIPMATDIAFLLAILALLGNKVPLSLKIFLTALAIIDDLGAIIIISVFYSKNISFIYLGLAALLFTIMLVLNRLGVYILIVYLVVGCLMWYCMYKSGIHPTITGVLLAFAIPFGNGNKYSPSYILQKKLHLPVALIILPLFAIVNTAIVMPSGIFEDIISSNGIGIFLGLFIGKPIGIYLFSLIALTVGISKLPSDLKKIHLLSSSFLCGIGFTMSIFISLLAFNNNAISESSKLSTIIASVFSALVGYCLLHLTLKRTGTTK